MPNLGNIFANKLNVPPYIVGAATISSPAWSMFNIAAFIAPIPDAKATAPTPPSSNAILSSNTATVGFDILE